MTDEYAAAAEFYDLMATPYVASVEPALTALLAGVDTLAGPVLEIGAGTGLSTMMVADAVPDARIVAVEPAPAMRAVLLSRLASRKDLRERITVLPTGFLDSELPAHCAAVVALGVIGHFDAATRPRVWRAIATALAPDGEAVVEVQRPGRVEVSAERRYTQPRVGLLRYEGWSRAEPVDAESLIWHMTYRTYHDDRMLREVVVRHRVWPADAEQLGREAKAVGLNLAATDTATGLLRFTKDL
ncbi:putative O-methyltransferase YrrM [Nocardia sp. GAS34]|uniref:class I SAM-dependent methyltransferase n=1 Tax=unclassified Nocardia TaxID=2637762 RepID=UPI003D1E5F67